MKCNPAITWCHSGVQWLSPFKRFLRSLLYGLGLTLASANAWAQVSSSISSISSVASADAALREISQQRTLIQAQHLKQEEACLPVFFTNSCLDNARENRRAALAKLRPVEIEANAFKRHAKVEERDRELAAKQLKPDSDKLQDADPTAVPVAKSGKHIGVGISKDKARTTNLTKQKASRPQGLDLSTQTRNMAAYDKKLAASAKRQKAVVARKAAAEKKGLKKQATPAASSSTATP